MPRFFVDPAAICGDHIMLDAEILSHLRVLRLRPEETFVVCDGAGRDYACVLRGERGEIIAQSVNDAEPPVDCVVYLAYTRGERMDYAIQKSVELGASAIYLFPAERCVVKVDGKDLPKKLARFEKIALEAAKQSGRGKIPPVIGMVSFKDAMIIAAQAEQALFFYENESGRTLRKALEADSEFRTVSLVIGPEGGFAENEVALAVELGLQTVSLGKRILRCETAPVAALAGVLFFVEG